MKITHCLLSWLALAGILTMASAPVTVAGAGKAVKSVEGIFYLDGSPVTIEIDGATIGNIIRKDKLDNPGSARVYVGPGLIDAQINGYVEIGFTDEGLTVEGVKKATQALWQDGVTTYLPTVISSSPKRLTDNFAVLAKALKDKDVALSVPGFHLEGPYISPVDGYRGAHNKEAVRDPDWKEFVAVNKAAKSHIIRVTIAPELPGAIEFIRNLRKAGIVVSLGHTAADAGQIKAAIDAGASIATHLGNGCANMIHRHNNPIWAQLADDRYAIGIIVDGFHLRPEEVLTFYRVKGPHMTILTSDVTKLAGMPPGSYTWDGKEVVLKPEGYISLPAQNVLAGAAAPIGQSVSNVIKFTHCSLGDAINMASRTPARLHGLTDRGEIVTGQRADLILFTFDDDGMIQIKQTILAGKVVYTAAD